MLKYLRYIDVKPEGILAVFVFGVLTDIPLSLAVAVNALIHELGHLVALRCFHCRIRSIVFDHTGFCIKSNMLCLSGAAHLIVAVSGPVLGGMIGLITSFLGNVLRNESILLFSGIGLLLTLFNMIPAKPLDGWRIVCVLLPHYSRMIGISTSLFIIMFGIGLLYCGYGASLAFMGLILLLQDYEEDLFV